MTQSIDYTPDEWHTSAGHYPLKGRPSADLLLLRRHWIWANQQREAMDALMQTSSIEASTPGPLMMVAKEIGFMFVWYGLLWSVIEACSDPGEGRCLDIRGPFHDDINQVGKLLKRCRNAVLHVPRSGELLDDRIEKLVAERETAFILRRIHRGFAQMFLEEFQRRKQLPPEVVPSTG
jgi:hypothetical protein